MALLLCIAAYFFFIHLTPEEKYEVDSLIQEINELGEVQLDHDFDDDLSSAESMYDQLSLRAKLHVSNRKVLQDDREQFDYLYGKELSYEIECIGTVDLDSEEDILNCISSYDQMTKQQKKNVDNYDDLQNALTTLSKLKIEDVESLINELNDTEITLKSEDKIQIAQSSYDELTDEQKKQISNYSILQNATDTLDKCYIADVETAINNLNDMETVNKVSVDGAQLKYDKLTQEQKAKVSNYDLLKKASDKLSQTQVQNVIKKIDQLNDKELLSKSLIDEARSAYYDLTEEQKKTSY